MRASCSTFADVGGFAAEEEVVARRREEIDHLGVFATGDTRHEFDPAHPTPVVTGASLALIQRYPGALHDILPGVRVKATIIGARVPSPRWSSATVCYSGPATGTSASQPCACGQGGGGPHACITPGRLRSLAQSVR